MYYIHHVASKSMYLFGTENRAISGKAGTRFDRHNYATLCH